LEKQKVPRRENVQPKMKVAPLMNRFQLLNIDATDDSEDEEASGITFQSTMSPSTMGVVA
jgi:hypothetical protein